MEKAEKQQTDNFDFNATLDRLWNSYQYYKWEAGFLRRANDDLLSLLEKEEAKNKKLKKALEGQKAGRN